MTRILTGACALGSTLLLLGASAFAGDVGAAAEKPPAPPLSIEQIEQRVTSWFTNLIGPPPADFRTQVAEVLLGTTARFSDWYRGSVYSVMPAIGNAYATNVIAAKPEEDGFIKTNIITAALPVPAMKINRKPYPAGDEPDVPSTSTGEITGDAVQLLAWMAYKFAGESGEVIADRTGMPIPVNK